MVRFIHLAHNATTYLSKKVTHKKKKNNTQINEEKKNQRPPFYLGDTIFQFLLSIAGYYQENYTVLNGRHKISTNTF
jgi:hypothetical protein